MDTPPNRFPNPLCHRNGNAPHPIAPLPASMRLGRDTSQYKALDTFASLASPGTFGKTVTDEEVL